MRRTLSLRPSPYRDPPWLDRVAHQWLLSLSIAAVVGVLIALLELLRWLGLLV